MPFRRILIPLILVLAHVSTSTMAKSAAPFSMSSWFRDFKQSATPHQMYQFLHALPKGGDLHHHLSGSSFSEWWYELASDPSRNGGYTYYTRVYKAQCKKNELTVDSLLYVTISEATYRELSRCEQNDYVQLASLSSAQRDKFNDSIRLNPPFEGREAFFSTHWQRLNEMLANPVLLSKLLLRNMQAYQRENLQYLETQVNVRYAKKPDGSPYTADEALAVYTTMLESEQAKRTGVTVRFQYALVRFLPDAEAQLEWIYQFVDSHRDYYVGINLVGREDNENGQPLRFLKTLRALRARYPKIALAFHAGESETADTNVRNTLLLGADRIGHGLNTVFDTDTLLLMRHNRYLIEINLISNLLLEYVPNYATHPFPEYLRTGIPTALSTDDRGMFDSTLTDEYYVAVTQFNLSWEELVLLGDNSLRYSFLPEDIKQQHRDRYRTRLAKFTANISSEGIVADPNLTLHSFICHFEPVLCL